MRVCANVYVCLYVCLSVCLSVCVGTTLYDGCVMAVCSLDIDKWINAPESDSSDDEVSSTSIFAPSTDRASTWVTNEYCVYWTVVKLMWYVQCDFSFDLFFSFSFSFSFPVMF